MRCWFPFSVSLFEIAIYSCHEARACGLTLGMFEVLKEHCAKTLVQARKNLIFPRHFPWTPSDCLVGSHRGLLQEKW